jgi:hypothetical protein
MLVVLVTRSFYSMSWELIVAKRQHEHGAGSTEDPIHWVCADNGCH